MKTHPWKSVPRLLAVMLLFSVTLTMWADDETDHNALRVIKAAYEQAVNTGNPAGLAPHLAAHATGVMVTGDAVEGIAGLEAYWKKVQQLIGPGGSYQVAVKVDMTDLLGDVAVSRGTTDDVVRLPNGRELKFNSQWTSVCQRQSDGWKVLRMQATLNPVDNVFVAFMLQKAKLTYGLGGLALGAVVAFLILKLRRSTS